MWRSIKGGATLGIIIQRSIREFKVVKYMTLIMWMVIWFYLIDFFFKNIYYFIGVIYICDLNTI